VLSWFSEKEDRNEHHDRFLFSSSNARAAPQSRVDRHAGVFTRDLHGSIDRGFRGMAGILPAADFAAARAPLPGAERIAGPALDDP
jgi:hypothetical protein